MRYWDDKSHTVLVSILLLLAILLSGCKGTGENSKPIAERASTALVATLPAPSALPATSPSQLLPDLVVESISIEWEVFDECFSIPDTAIYWVEIRIANRGDAEAGRFGIVVADFWYEVVSGGLRKGEARTYTVAWTDLVLDVGETASIELDVGDEVIESNEENNYQERVISAPTSVPACPSIEPTPCPEPTTIPLFSDDHKITFSDLHMLDRVNGWVVSGVEDEHEHILRTDDGGNSWMDVTPPQFTLECNSYPFRASGYFYNADLAWVTYYEGTSGRGFVGTWRTIDGGETWERISFLQSNTDTIGGLYPWPILEFIDSQQGWLLIDYFLGAGSHGAELYRTIDGGRSWELIPEAYLTRGNGLDFIDRMHGWETSNHPIVVYMGLDITNDSGYTWHSQKLPYPSELLDIEEYDPYSCYVSSPRLRTPQIGFVIVHCGRDYFTYTSTDSGQTWRITPIPGGPSQFINPLTGWVLISRLSDAIDPEEGGLCDLYKTDDGGQMWTKVSTVDWCGKLNFVSEKVAWAVAELDDETALMHTTDGGRTWERLTPHVVTYELAQPRDISQYLILPTEIQPIDPDNLQRLQVFAEIPDKDATRLTFHHGSGDLWIAHADGTLTRWVHEETSYPSSARIHTDWIYDLDFSLDGNWVAMASKSGELALEGLFAWRILTNDIQTLTMNDGEVTSVAFSPGSDILAAGYEDATIVTWQYSDFGVDTQMRSQLKGHTGWVWDIAFSPDGGTLASASSDRTVRLWDAEREVTLHTLRGHTSTVWRVAFSPDGQVLASASWDGSVKLWDPASGAELRTLRGHTDWVTDLAFSPSGEILATASKDGTVLLWSLERGEALRTLWEHQTAIKALAFSPDGSLLATVSEDGYLRLWGIEA